MKKFDIYLVDLNPRKGHVQAGVRPYVIIQSNAFNPYSSTLMMVPLTSNQKKVFPSEFLIHPSKKNGLSEDSRYLGDQVMVLDKKFLVKKLGELEEEYYPQVHESLSIAFDIENWYLDEE